MGRVFSAKGKPYPGFDIEIGTRAGIAHCSVCEQPFMSNKCAYFDNSSMEYSPIVLCLECVKKLVKELET